MTVKTMIQTPDPMIKDEEDPSPILVFSFWSGWSLASNESKVVVEGVLDFNDVDPVAGMTGGDDYIQNVPVDTVFWGHFWHVPSYINFSFGWQSSLAHFIT